MDLDTTQSPPALRLMHFCCRISYYEVPLLFLRRTECWTIKFVMYDTPKPPIFKELQSNKLYLHNYKNHDIEQFSHNSHISLVPFS